VTTLRELEARLIRREIRACAPGPSCSVLSPHTQHEYHCDVDDIAAADGVRFLCPLCFKNNRGRVGTHSVICWRPRVPAGVPPVPGRWEFQGTGLGDLTLVAVSSSILLQGGCGAHFFIRRGAVEW
jgi:hypothetical protein